MNDRKRIMFAIFRLGREANIKQRVIESAPKIKSVIESLSRNECQLAFTTSDGSTFGYLLKTSASTQSIRAALFGTSDKSTGTSPLLSDDNYLIVEVGQDFDSVGFSRAWNWIGHHQ